MISDLFHGKTPEILIADDTLDSLRLLSDSLANHGYDVRSVTNGTLAIASVQIVQPDLILLDIKMPDLSGYEVCQQLKADPLTQDIPVMFISALNEPFDRVQAFAVGGVDYITKPFHLDEVLARIRSQLSLRFSLTQIQKLNAELEQRVQKRTLQLEQANQNLRQEVLERMQIERSLRESETKFRQISEHIQEVFWLAKVDQEQQQVAELEYVSPAYEAIWGRSIQLVYQNRWDWSEAIHPDDRPRVQASALRNAVQGCFDEEYRIIHHDGSIRWIHDRGFPIRNSSGDVVRVAGIAEDITARKRAEIERDRFFNLSLDLLFIASQEGLFKRLNAAWETLLGYHNQELLDQSLWDIIHPEDCATAHFVIQQLSQGHDVNDVEMRCRCRDGSYVWIAWNAVPFPQESLVYGAGHNISQRKASEAQLIYETLHDSLTGLANRACFMERLAIATRKCRRQSELCFAVLFIDLDGFKSINDTLGHLVGDQLLVQIALLLKETVREVDSVARLGGDEFTILLEDIQSLKEVLHIVERIQEKLTCPLHIDMHEIFTSASIGIVFGTADYGDVSDIIRDADIAMYRAKANGKGCYEVFDQSMYAQTLYVVDLENHLRHAIRNQELKLYYQPIVNLDNNFQLEGLEVLLRWEHSSKGLIPASEFIAIAENAGLIGAISEWVLEKACIQFQMWRSEFVFLKDLYLSINVSGRQLKDFSLDNCLEKVLKETKLPASCLKFEITESSLIENTQIATQIMQSLQDRGSQISLDDFGTGFSSLRYLHQFPIDTIKIDRSFVEMLQQGSKERSIIQSIITLAHALGFSTVAEGIETEYQLAQLKMLGCKAGQGFLFAKPMSRQTMEDFFRQNYNTNVYLPSNPKIV